jgi:hypothetical protein
MIPKSFIIIGTLSLFTAVAHAGSPPPKELYGKSIIVRWVEHHNWRLIGEADFRDVDIPLLRMIYISSKGKSFVRFAAGGRSESRREHIGTSERGAGGGADEVQFSGRTITVFSVNRGGMARKMTIELNESFTTCEAHVIWAKKAGSDVVVSYDLATRAPAREIRSTTVTGVSCAVQEGNVFAP